MAMTRRALRATKDNLIDRIDADAANVGGLRMSWPRLAVIGDVRAAVAAPTAAAFKKTHVRTRRV
jgi:hypothetical protein